MHRAESGERCGSAVVTHLMIPELHHGTVHGKGQCRLRLFRTHKGKLIFKQGWI